MRKNNSRVDPFKGVVNPDILRSKMKEMVQGCAAAKSYCRGALSYLEKNPPNKHIVGVLRRAMELAK